MRTNLIASTLFTAAIAGTSAAPCGGYQAASACSAKEANASAMTAVAHVEAPDIVDTAVNSGNFRTLVAAVQAAGLVDALKGNGPFTVFAPTDEAFAKLPSGTIDELLLPENRGLLTSILTYHVVPGSIEASEVVAMSKLTTLSGQRVDLRVSGDNVHIDNARILATDIETSNGIIHVIDTVIMPVTDTIPAVAKEAGKFNTLIAAVKAAGLAGTLMGDGPFTVLAPTDDAFAALGHTVNDLLKPENRHQLQEILKTHVISGRIYADDAFEATAANSLQGTRLHFNITDAKLMVANATILATDIEASNGVIHVIDTVLMPN